MKKAELPVAEWSVYLHVDCPHCGEFVDLLENADTVYDLDICERRDDYDAVCPECGKEFTCKTTY